MRKWVSFLGLVAPLILAFDVSEAQEFLKPARILFIPGDGPGRADVGHDDSTWVEIAEDLRDGGWYAKEAGLLGGGSVGWYRLHFDMPPDPRDVAWTVSAGFLGNLSEAYWDGKFLGGYGTEEKGFLVLPPQRTIHAWPLTEGMLAAAEGGGHVLAIRVRRVAGTGGMLGGPVGLYPSTEFVPLRSRLELGREAVVAMVASFAITWGLIFVFVRWIGDSAQPWVFGAGLFVATGVVHLMSTRLFTSPTMGTTMDPWFVVAVAVYWGVPLLSPWLICGLCGGTGSLREWVVTLAGLTLLLLALAGNDDFSKVIVCYGILLVMVGMVAVSRVAAGWKQKRMEVLPVIVGLVCLTVATAAQISLFWMPWMNLAASVWQPMDVGILAGVSSVGGSFFRRYAVARKNERIYAHRLLESQRLERARIGRHLHDGVAQDLQYLLLTSKQWAADSEDSSRATVVLEGIESAIREVRRSAEDLQPLALREGTLKAAIQSLVARLNERHDCEVTLDFDPLPDLLKSEEEALFRAASEGAMNACRHARAASVRIRVFCVKGLVVVKVSDDGNGFDPSGLSSERLGLKFLRDQAELTGGDLVIVSRPGNGTDLEYRLSPRDSKNTVWND